MDSLGEAWCAGLMAELVEQVISGQSRPGEVCRLVVQDPNEVVREECELFAEELVDRCHA